MHGDCAKHERDYDVDRLLKHGVGFPHPSEDGALRGITERACDYGGVHGLSCGYWSHAVECIGLHLRWYHKGEDVTGVRRSAVEAHNARRR